MCVSGCVLTTTAFVDSCAQCCFSVFDLLLRLSLILITPFIDYHDSIFSRLSKEKKTNGNTRNGHSNHEPVSFDLFDNCVCATD